MRNMIFLSICIFAYLDVVCSLFQYCFHKNPMLIVSKLLGISLHIVSLDVHLHSGNNNYTKYSNGQQYLFCHFVAIPHVRHNLQFYLVIKLLCSSENECFVFYHHWIIIFATWTLVLEALVVVVIMPCKAQKW